MILNSVNCNFYSTIQKEDSFNYDDEIIKSYSKNFRTNVNIKSNVQKKNNTIALIKKKDKIKD